MILLCSLSLDPGTTQEHTEHRHRTHRGTHTEDINIEHTQTHETQLSHTHTCIHTYYIHTQTKQNTHRAHVHTHAYTGHTQRVLTSMTASMSNCSFLAPSMHVRNFFTTFEGIKSSLRGSNWEEGRKAYSFITISVSPPKNSIYSPERIRNRIRRKDRRRKEDERRTRMG